LLLSKDLIQLTCTENGLNWQENQPIHIQRIDDEYFIRQGDTVGTVTVITNKSRLSIQIQQDKTLWLLRHIRGNTLQLQWLELVEHQQLDMSISVDEAIAEDLYKKGEVKAADVSTVLNWLYDEFVVKENENLTDISQVFVGRFDNESSNSFLLFGKSWQGQLKRHNGVLKLINLTKSRNISVQLALIIGKVQFLDASVAAQIQSPEQQAKLDAALRDNGSYLKLWEEYGNLEWEQAQSCANSLGSLLYTEATLREDEQISWSFKVNKEQLNHFKTQWKMLELADSTQVELGEREFDLKDFSSTNVTNKGFSERQAIRGEIQFEKNSLIFVPSNGRQTDKPPIKGYIYYSLSGEKAVQDRREKAKESILRGQRLPQLSYLLEGVAPPTARHRHIDGLSAYVKSCFKGSKPTEQQKLALDIAINTPDIALIVGPPGTGKTQVIAALQRRLAETFGNSLQHQVLISSFQHDAVDNALNRAEVFGLPAVRIGGKNRQDEGSVNPITIWRKRKQKEVDVRLQEVQQKEPLTPITSKMDRCLTLLRLASLAPEERFEQFQLIDELLQRLADYEIRLSPNVRNEWADFLNRQSKTVGARTVSEPTGLLKLVRRLRTTPIGFSDDGANGAYYLIRALNRSKLNIEETDISLLNDLAEGKAVTIQQLNALAVFKNKMLDRLMPDYRPTVLKQVLNSEALDVLKKIEASIDAPLQHSRRGISFVLASYHAGLSQEPKRTEQTIREYASIVGATCQQAVGKSMCTLKEISALDESNKIEFDTVVIDEAARANPLDLFLPMSLARRRIVLVGDHRQLPHLIQRELEDELTSRLDLKEAQKEAYRKSLFERLVNQLRDQEKIDNIKRVVMLDTQYRMHPTLGDFISQQFYESEGLVLHSGRPASDFSHNIAGYQGQCCAWLNVPLIQGNEKRRGTSRIRLAEAEAIACEVKKMIDSEDSNISIGVISFYKAQCDFILKEFVKQGLAEEENGEIIISRAYRQTESGEERLRVGTVDSFQGKEFDVVFLSIVRANDHSVSKQKNDHERDILMTQKYGHLRVANRLNVAMSRQRKLLIAVGAKIMAEGDEAKEAIPALAAFLKLCDKEQLNGG
jgi:hypothetical protein